MQVPESNAWATVLCGQCSQQDGGYRNSVLLLEIAIRCVPGRY